MNDDKIFADLEGVLNWIETGIEEDEKHAIKEGRENQDKSQGPFDEEVFGRQHNFFKFKTKKEKISQVMGFLDITLTKEELSALDEIIDNGSKDFSFDGLKKTFLKNPREKEKEYNELMKAFSAISENSEEHYITLDNLKLMLTKHEIKYLGSLDTIIEEIKDSDHYDEDAGKFYFKKYLMEVYSIEEEESEGLEEGEEENQME